MKDFILSARFFENINPGDTVYFKIKACNGEKRCSKYTTVSQRIIPAAPKVSLSSTKAKKVYISMLYTYEEPHGIEIYRSTSKNGKYELVKDIDGSNPDYDFTGIDVDYSADPYSLKISFNDKTKTGKTYYYKVRSYVFLKNGKKAYSKYSSIKSIKSK